MIAGILFVELPSPGRMMSIVIQSSWPLRSASIPGCGMNTRSRTAAR
jgi:hypothetical protein